MYRHVIAAFAVAATSVLLSAGPVAADSSGDWPECTTYTVSRLGWAPNWPMLDTLGIREIIQSAPGTVRVCVGPNARPALERFGFTYLPG